MQHRLILTKIPTTEQAKVLRWLALPEGLLFRRLLETTVTQAQLSAGAELSCNPLDPHNIEKAQKSAVVAHQYLAALSVLDTFSTVNGKEPSASFDTLTLTT